MPHVTDNDLVLHFYGEALEDRSAVSHLATCPECQARLDNLQSTLDQVELPVPPRPDNYGQQVWTRLAPKLVSGRNPRIPRYLWVAAAAACLAIAFFAGRYNPPSPSMTASTAVRERVLIVAVGGHLERSRIVLAELINAGPDRAAAESLLEANRLYRQTAVAAGDRPVASLLDDLERVLLEVAHTPDSASPIQWQQIRDRIEAQGLVFKINIIESELEDRVAKPSAQL